MDNKKIGKLIATLRRNIGLTQQELGDKVGVGFRAVSKWERGINLPDISIINDLSKILGISSDELLSGELNPEKYSDNNKDKKKLSIPLKITITSIIAIALIFTTIFLYLNNKTYLYELENKETADYYIKGQATFRRDKLTIIISELGFTDKEFKSIIIKNYEYKVMSDNIYLFGYGYTSNFNSFEEIKTIQKFAEEFRINYIGEMSLNKKEIINNKLYLIINFVDQNDKLITKEIEISLIEKNQK